MYRQVLFYCLLIGPALLSFSITAKADTTFIKFGSSWKYLDNGSAAPVAAGASDWRSIAFNDAAWKSGRGEFGYGGNRERTTVRFGTNPNAKYITTYFRSMLNVSGIENFATLHINAYIDDGAIIYINGNEVGRYNLKGAVTASTLAALADDNGNSINSFIIPASTLINGNNIIAVEVHQNAPTSSDLSFDMELVARPGNNPEPDVVHGPYLQMVSGDAVTIRWSTSAATTSRVKYGANENSLTNSLSDKKVSTDHELRITGLKPDTRYFYAIGTKTSILKGSYRNYFNTAPPNETKRKIRIGVFGDPGTGTFRQKSSRDNYLKLKGGYNNAEMVIMLGDNAYNAGTETEHTLNFFNIYDNNIFDNHSIFPVPGNHEYANDANRAADHNIPYYNVFSVPTKGECGGVPSNTKHYYSYDYGNIHFIMLDSYGIDGGNHLYDDTTNGQQAVWLKADLAANAGKHKWMIVCLHHPPYTNGSHVSDAENDLIAIRRKITPILERFGVDVVLAGHSHVYERSFLIRDHIGFSESFNKGTIPGGVAVSLSNARYDGSVPTAKRPSADTAVATSSCPYFTIDSVYKHGTVYVVAGSAGQIGSNNTNSYPLFYTRNQGASSGGESGALYLEIQDNRLDAKFVGNSGTIRDQFTIMKGVNRKTTVAATVRKPATLTASWIGGYTWAGIDNAPAAQGNMRSVTIHPAAAGNFIYVVSDSLNATCISDTFTVQVTSPVAAAIRNYRAVAKNNTVLVQWTTLQEKNSDYFSIERSGDGEHFETLMAIDGQHQSVQPTGYEFSDNKPLSGKAYYRLTAVDKTGNRVVAGVESIDLR